MITPPSILISAISKGMDEKDFKVADIFLLILFVVQMKFIVLFLLKDTWNLKFKRPGNNFYAFSGTFYDSLVKGQAYLTLDLQSWVQIPGGPTIFFHLWPLLME